MAAPSGGASADKVSPLARGGADEAVLFEARPHPAYMVLRSLGAIVWIGVLAGLMALLSRFGVIRVGAIPFVLVGLAVAGLVVLWRAVDWACRRFVLMERRVEASWGVLRRSSVEAPVSAVRNIVLHQSVRERMFGLGTLGFATAATDGVEVVWPMVARPHELLALARRACAGERGEPAERKRMPIIGLAGGIGAGKSALAAALKQRGCVVIDSDRVAKELLDRADVRKQITGWWGEKVLGKDGRIDHRALAGVVFEDEDSRQRLEGLIHPLVKQERAEAVRAAEAAGAVAVVIDAPLLFEAGVDGECDYIVFVDAPRSLRLERVRSRGWDEAELERRETAQWDLDRKRGASDEVVKNHGTPADLERAADQVLSAAARNAGRHRQRSA